MTLLLKTGKDPTCLQSYRAISLLNSDYKILATILANRLNIVLSAYIHPDQAGFIKKRQLKNCTRRLCNIMDYLQTQKIPAPVYFCDAEKAFDRVNWGFLKKVMRKMGFGSYFMHWIDLIYSLQLAEIGLEGHQSRQFTIGRRVRQGYPLSPLLFNLTFEVLALII